MIESLTHLDLIASQQWFMEVRLGMVREMEETRLLVMQVEATLPDYSTNAQITIEG